LDVLKVAGVGLWDTVRSATRKGSLDTAIRAVEAAPLADLAATLPSLRAVAFNGGTAARMGLRQLASRTDLALVQLPSSSPAYCRISSDAKQTQWNTLQKFLG
jgi:hypoxanthine-DNA glycosylase